MSFFTRLLDPAPRERVAGKYRFTDDWRAWVVAAGVGVALLLVSLIALFGDDYTRARFMFAYLTGWTFCLSISLGALLFVMAQHITKAKWVTVVRRVPEMIMANFVLLAVLSIPIVIDLISSHSVLYHWRHPELYVAGPDFDPVLAEKTWYLNLPFALGRIAFYFFVWIVVSTKLYRESVRQDTDPIAETSRRLRFTSGWGIPLVGVTTAFAGFDFLMGLDPHWFSTMFGVYFFAGGFVASIALTTFLVILFKRTGPLEGVVTTEHLQDLGKYLFAFTAFWAYIAFSQYMLIWYANLPEETLFYEHRFQHGWEAFSKSLVWFHFVLPFLILLPRAAKRLVPVLAVMAVWTLVMHWMDHFWVAMPVVDILHGAELHATGAASEAVHEVAEHAPHAGFHWVDFAAWFGLFGLFLGATLWRAGRHSATPYNDPYFAQSVRFENV